MVMTEEKKSPQEPQTPLIWSPGSEKEEPALTADSSAMVEYLLNPPQGYPKPGGNLNEKELEERRKLMEKRREALTNLIDSAFSP